MEDRVIPACETRTEIVVLHSRFIATLAPVFTVEEAREFVARVKSEFADASHHVPAYLVGHGNTVTAHCSDAGEPSGTAGRPALAVLRGSGLGDVAVVVTRYFGGTKLGTGGLVRAYGDAVREVLAHTPRAAKVLTDVLSVTMPYSAFEPVRLLIQAHGGVIVDQDFAAQVTVMARFPATEVDAFTGGLAELSNGQLVSEVVVHDEAVIMPLSRDSDVPDLPADGR